MRRETENSRARVTASTSDRSPASEAAIPDVALSEGAPPRTNTSREAGSRRANVLAQPMVLSPSGTKSRRKAERADHALADTPHTRVSAQTSSGNRGRSGHDRADTQTAPAAPQEPGRKAGRRGQCNGDSQRPVASPEPSPEIASIRELNRRRTDFKLAQNAILLRAKAICRRLCDGDKGEAQKLYTDLVKALNPNGKVSDHPHLPDAMANATPHIDSMKAFDEPLKAVEDEIAIRIRALPLWAKFKDQRGLAEISFGQLIGEIGDPALYRSPAGMWKRMGVGRFQSPKTGEWLTQRNYTDRDTAIAAGYVARRRSALFVIGDNLVKLNKSEYRKCYADRKAYEQAQNVAGAYAEQAASMLAKFPKAAAASRKCWKAGKLTPGHIDKRAKRYMTKRLLKHMWQHARKLAGISDPVPAAGPEPDCLPQGDSPAATLAGRQARVRSTPNCGSPAAPATTTSGRRAKNALAPKFAPPSVPLAPKGRARANPRSKPIQLAPASLPPKNARRRASAGTATNVPVPAVRASKKRRAA